MKKRRLVLLLALVMIMTVVLPVMAKEKVTDTKVQWLIDKGWVVGRGRAQGYALDSRITRAEVTKMLVASQGLGSEAKKDGVNAGYNDVPMSHWAAGYIKTATEKGYIKGYGNNTFRPDAFITNDEAIAIMVRMHPSWTAQMEKDAKWPTSYRDFAPRAGITVGVALGNKYDKEAIRRDVFDMVYNLVHSKTVVEPTPETYKDDYENIRVINGRKEYYVDGRWIDSRDYGRVDGRYQGTEDYYYDSAKGAYYYYDRYGDRVYDYNYRRYDDYYYDAYGRKVYYDDYRIYDRDDNLDTVLGSRVYYNYYKGGWRYVSNDNIANTSMARPFSDRGVYYNHYYEEWRDSKTDARVSRYNRYDGRKYYGKIEKIRIVADNAPKGRVFDQWTVDRGSYTLSRAEREKATLELSKPWPTGNVTFKANYKNDYYYSHNVKRRHITGDRYEIYNFGYRDQVRDIPNPTAPTGYKFVGWAETSTGRVLAGDRRLSDLANNRGYLELYAKFEKNEYTVRFDSNGGTSVANKPVKYGEKVAKPSDPTRTGYKFKYWAYGGSEYNFDTKVTKDMTLRAVWTADEVKVTLNANGGGLVKGVNEVNTLDYNTVFTRPADPTRDGYKFLGWKLDNKAYNFSDKVTKDIELVAEWEEIEYIVKLNVGKDGQLAEGTKAENKVKYNQKFGKPADPTTTNDKLEFEGWKLDDKEYDFTQIVTKDIELVAEWKEKGADE